MMECRDINELLIDYLYEELDPAKTAELEGHLQNCPTCKAEISSLQRTRHAVRGLPELEPSPAISTRLLHEASKHAPKSSGWFGWLAQLFQPVVTHPAWTAGVTAIVIIGVVALFKNRNLSPPAMSVSEPAAAPAPAAPSAPQPTPVPTESYAEDQPRPVRESAGEAVKEGGKVAAPSVAAAQKGSGQGYDKSAPTGRIASEPEMKPLRAAKKEAAVSKDAKRAALDLPPEPAPADISSRNEVDHRAAEKAPAKPSPQPETPADTGKLDDGRRRDADEERQATPTPTVAASPPPPPSQAADQNATGAGGPPAPSAEAAKAAPQTTMASPSDQQLFQQAQSEAAGGRCQNALAIAQKIQRQNPDFYKRRILGDPTLRTCSDQLRKQAPAKAKARDSLESPAPAEQQQQKQ